MKAGKKFELVSKSNTEIIEPLDIELLKSLRKKHGL